VLGQYRLPDGFVWCRKISRLDFLLNFLSEILRQSIQCCDLLLHGDQFTTPRISVKVDVLSNPLCLPPRLDAHVNPLRVVRRVLLVGGDEPQKGLTYKPTVKEASGAPSGGIGSGRAADASFRSW
jgi:hypothetical protein